MMARGKKRAGRILDGQLWNEMPQPLGFHGQDWYCPNEN